MSSLSVELSAFAARLQAALALELPYPERAPFDSGQPASVLALFARHAGEISLLMTKRTETVETHKGQMAFPGGRCEPDELGSEAGFARAALRETEEEVGIARQEVQLVGRLPGMWTVTGYWIHPFVGLLARDAEEVPILIDPIETAETLWIPLAQLQHPDIYRREFRQVGAVNWPIHVYQIGPHRIWGATGALIKNLLDRLEKV